MIVFPAIVVAAMAVIRSAIAVATLLTFTVINCLGVRSGSNVQSTLMVVKIAAILMLVILGWKAVNGLGFAAWDFEKWLTHTSLLDPTRPSPRVRGAIGKSSAASPRI